MSCEEESSDILRRAGHKMTPQRLLIVRALRHAQGHISAPQILDQVRQTYPFVDVSTVYRTLDVLKRMGVATSTDLGAGDVMFEWTPERPHHHLICTSCGSVIELRHAYLEPLECRLDADFSFQANLDHFAIFGLCRGCRMSEGAG